MPQGQHSLCKRGLISGVTLAEYGGAPSSLRIQLTSNGCDYRNLRVRRFHAAASSDGAPAQSSASQHERTHVSQRRGANRSEFDRNSSDSRQRELLLFPKTPFHSG